MFKSWKTTLAGVVPGLLLFLQSWLTNGHTLDWHNPTLLVGAALAVLGIVGKDYNVTGGNPPAKGE